jgi:hypothetical protein
MRVRHGPDGIVSFVIFASFPGIASNMQILVGKVLGICLCDTASIATDRPPVYGKRQGITQLQVLPTSPSLAQTLPSDAVLDALKMILLGASQPTRAGDQAYCFA